MRLKQNRRTRPRNPPRFIDNVARARAVQSQEISPAWAFLSSQKRNEKARREPPRSGGGPAEPAQRRRARRRRQRSASEQRNASGQRSTSKCEPAAQETESDKAWQGRPAARGAESRRRLRRQAGKCGIARAFAAAPFPCHRHQKHRPACRILILVSTPRSSRSRHRHCPAPSSRPRSALLVRPSSHRQAIEPRAQNVEDPRRHRGCAPAASARNASALSIDELARLPGPRALISLTQPRPRVRAGPRSSSSAHAEPASSRSRRGWSGGVKQAAVTVEARRGRLLPASRGSGARGVRSRVASLPISTGR